MFKKRCPNCNEKLSRKSRFCSNCGHSFKNMNEEDYGLLGETDEQEDFDEVFGGFGGGMFNKMLSGAMKMLEKEMNKSMSPSANQRRAIPKTNFQLYVNGKKVNLGEEGMSMQQPMVQSVKKRKLPVPSDKIIQSSLKLPRKEPKTIMRREGNKVVYELNLPGIHSEEQLLISKLEGSTEVKAFAKDKVYSKIIPLKMALVLYSLENQKLFLEFQGK